MFVIRMEILRINYLYSYAALLYIVLHYRNIIGVRWNQTITVYTDTISSVSSAPLTYSNSVFNFLKICTAMCHVYI